MIKFDKEIFKKALLAGFFSAFTIGILTVLTYKSALGLFLAGSFGSSMVLLFGFPESPFAQPKNVFFGHLITALVGVVFVNLITLPIYISIALAVGVGIFLMILLNIVHPPAGGNPIMVIIGSVSYDYLILPIIISIPYYFSIYNITFINAYFESVSGFTSTGFSIFENIKHLDESLILWRSSSQWIGGLYFLFSIILLNAQNNQ